MPCRIGKSLGKRELLSSSPACSARRSLFQKQRPVAREKKKKKKEEEGSPSDAKENNRRAESNHKSGPSSEGEKMAEPP